MSTPPGIIGETIWIQNVLQVSAFCVPGALIPSPSRPEGLHARCSLALCPGKACQQSAHWHVLSAWTPDMQHQFRASLVCTSFRSTKFEPRTPCLNPSTIKFHSEIEV